MKLSKSTILILQKREGKVSQSKSNYDTSCDMVIFIYKGGILLISIISFHTILPLQSLE